HRGPGLSRASAPEREGGGPARLSAITRIFGALWPGVGSPLACEDPPTRLAFARHSSPKAGEEPAPFVAHSPRRPIRRETRLRPAACGVTIQLVRKRTAWEGAHATQRRPHPDDPCRQPAAARR